MSIVAKVAKVEWSAHLCCQMQLQLAVSLCWSLAGRPLDCAGWWTQRKGNCASNCRPCGNSRLHTTVAWGICNNRIEAQGREAAVWCTQRSLKSPPAKRTVIFRLRSWHLLFYVKMLQLCASRLIFSSIFRLHCVYAFYFLFLQMPQFAAAPATADLHFSLPLTIKLFPALLLPFYYYFFCVIIIIIFVPQLWHKLAAAFFTNRIRIFAATNAAARCHIFSYICDASQIRKVAVAAAATAIYC